MNAQVEIDSFIIFALEKIEEAPPPHRAALYRRLAAVVPNKATADRVAHLAWFQDKVSTFQLDLFQNLKVKP